MGGFHCPRRGDLFLFRRRGSAPFFGGFLNTLAVPFLNDSCHTVPHTEYFQTFYPALVRVAPKGLSSTGSWAVEEAAVNFHLRTTRRSLAVPTGAGCLGTFSALSPIMKEKNFRIRAKKPSSNPLGRLMKEGRALGVL